MSAYERAAEWLVVAGFVAVAAGLWWLRPPGAVEIGPGVACIVVLALSARVRIDTPFGFTAPTQLAFVPLLFALPVAIVPLAVVAVTALARLPDVVSGEVSAARLVAGKTC